MDLRRLVCAALLACALAVPSGAQDATGAKCTTTFMDALGQNNGFFDIFKDDGLNVLTEGIKLAGYSNKLPDQAIGYTVFAPTNKAFFNLLTHMGLGFRDLLSLGDKLPGIVGYHVALGSYSQAQLSQATALNTVLGQITGNLTQLKFKADPKNSGQVLISGLYSDSQGRIKTSRKVCNSWVHIIDTVLLPTSVSAIPAIDLGNLKLPSFSAAGPGASYAPAPASTEPGCNTTLLGAVQGQSSLSLLRQGLLAGNLTSQLPDPAAGAGVTVFAPTNDAFLKLLQTLQLSPADTQRLGAKLTGVLLYHILPGARDLAQLAANGSAPTLLSERTAGGSNFTLSFSTQNGQVSVRGLAPNNVATVLGNVTVCKSIIYIVDTVLLPAVSLDTIPQPTAPLPADCGTTFLQAAQAANLTFLTQALQATGLDKALPSAATGQTVFAPTNEAFYRVITNGTFGLTELAALGPKLTSVLLFHVLPGVFAPPALAGNASLNTLLGTALGANYSLSFARGGDQVTVAGLYPGNVATLRATIPVCGSLLHVVDAVLIPAPSLAAIPDPPPAFAAVGGVGGGAPAPAVAGSGLPGLSALSLSPSAGAGAVAVARSTAGAVSSSGRRLMAY